jgi:hypothetical protein
MHTLVACAPDKLGLKPGEQVQQGVEDKGRRLDEPCEDILKKLDRMKQQRVKRLRLSGGMALWKAIKEGAWQRVKKINDARISKWKNNPPPPPDPDDEIPMG